MKIINYFMLFVMSVMFFSCTANPNEDFFDFEEPKVTNVSPGDKKTGVTPEQEIIICFSEDVNKESAEASFSLTSMGNIEGIFSWDGNRKLIYTPKYGWTLGEKYTITVERTLQDVNRNRMQKKFVSTFYAGDDFEHPYATEDTNNPYIQNNPVIITLYFSKPMDMNSLQNAITVNPSFDYRIALNDGTFNGYPARSVLIIYATENLDSMAEYTLTISQKALSQTGLPLLRDYVYYFAMYSDTEKPTIISVERGDVTDMNTLVIGNRGDLFDETVLASNPVYKADCIIITFDEPVDRSSVENAFKISPSLLSRYYWKYETNQGKTNDVFIIKPDTGYEQDETYSFYFDETLKDLAGNKIDGKTNSYILKLLTFPPLVNQVIFNDGLFQEKKLPDAPDADYLAGYNDVLGSDGNGILIKDDITDTGEGELEISIYFDDISDVIPVSLYSNIAVKHVLGGAYGDPQIVRFYIDIVNNKIVVYLRDLYFKNEIDFTQIIYLLEIKGGPDGIRDNLGNYMENTLRIYFKVTGNFVP